MIPIIILYLIILDMSSSVGEFTVPRDELNINEEFEMESVTIMSFSDFYEDEELNQRPRAVTLVNLDFEPVVNISKQAVPSTKNLNCDEFSKYAFNCTLEAALIYNSSRKSPPLPTKMNDWCRSIRHLTNCAIDWNSECKEVTESHFNRESIDGHRHVIDNVCEDEWFTAHYKNVDKCIDKTSTAWEACYSSFKDVVVRQKNESQEWTHYVTHFYLCCARMKFRRCTFNALFDSSADCQRNHAVSLQNFSVIVSEGDVYQDCERNMMYSNCPGGDPRPTGNIIAKLMNKGDVDVNGAIVNNCVCALWCTLIMLIFL